MSLRIGIGYDVHKLVTGRELILGGVHVPFDKGLLGHSDADVLLHAIIDALLGAAALGDIGTHFPDSDGSYENISSLKLLSQANVKLRAAGYGIVNIDSVIVAQKPKLMAFTDIMRHNISDCLGIPVCDVSVKAKTEEGLGFTGRGDGIAAKAVCLIEPC